MQFYEIFRTLFDTILRSGIEGRELVSNKKRPVVHDMIVVKGV